MFLSSLNPVKASGQRTAQPSPAHISAIERAQGETHGGYLPTPDRVSVLRGLCLLRDHRRCVVSRKFDRKEAISRFQRHGGNFLDDERNQLRGQPFATLEVAHIIPHSLVQADAGGQLVRKPPTP